MVDASAPTDWQNGPTFGIEIECLGVFMSNPRSEEFELVFPTYSLASNPKIESEDPAWTVARSLEDFMAATDLTTGKPNFPKTNGVGTPLGLQKPDYSRWNVTVDSSVDVSDEQREEAEHHGTFFEFMKCGDHSISEWLRHQKAVSIEQRGNIHFGSIEIVSPVLPATAEGFEAVRKVYRFLNENSFVVNESAGMHVHAANQMYAGPSSIIYAQLLNITRWAMCAEFQLCKLVPAHRALQGSYNKLLTKLSYTRPTTQSYLHTMIPRQLYDRIGESTTAYRLCLHYGKKFCTINLANSATWDASAGDVHDPEPELSDNRGNPDSGSDSSLPEADMTEWEFNFASLAVSNTNAEIEGRPLARTVEFRMGEATLSADRAVNWIEFVTSVHRSARESTEPWEFLAGYHKDVSVDKMLTDMKLSEFIGKLPVFDHSWEDYVLTKSSW